MIEHPILFSAPMVRALLEGRKTQTRRIFKGTTPPNCPGKHECRIEDGFAKFYLDGKLAMHGGEWTKAKWSVGGKLWVRETFYPSPNDSPTFCGYYRATDPNRNVKWKPSIFMPRKASRITLEITRIRVERFDQIKVEDCLAEGIQAAPRDAYKQYALLWDSINGAGSWENNPWVWVLEFRKLST